MAIDAPPRELLTIPEIVETLHVSRQHAYRMIKRGDLPAIRLGARQGRGQMIRVARSDLVTYLQRVNSASEEVMP